MFKHGFALVILWNLQNEQKIGVKAMLVQITERKDEPWV